MRVCNICGNRTENKIHKAREMLFGYRDEFDYLECSFCGCIQLKDIPEDLEKYYPQAYWENIRLEEFFSEEKDRFWFWVKKQRTDFYLGKFTLIGYLASCSSEPPEVPVFSGWNWTECLKNKNLKRSSALLDIGCGMGSLLKYLDREGFTSLTGIDKHINQEFITKNIKILNKEIYDLDENFDVIMLHHSFEHMTNPFGIFQKLYELLNGNGFIVLRIPIVAYAWEKYNTSWVQLDPPRHLFLHTLKSINILAESANLKIENVEFDSNEFQFWASEQYLKDIPLNSEDSYLVNQKISFFTKEKINEYRKIAENLNKLQKGDQASFLLRKI